MDAKSKASFINSVATSVATNQEVVCTACGTPNKSDSKFCISCGKELSDVGSNDNSAAFSSVESNEESKTPVKYVEPVNVFAEGLPEWSVEPPQVVVRRH